MINPVFQTKLWNQFLASGFNIDSKTSGYIEKGRVVVMREGVDTFKIISHPESKPSALDAVMAITKFIQAEEESYFLRSSGMIELLPIFYNDYKANLNRGFSSC